MNPTCVSPHQKCLQTNQTTTITVKEGRFLYMCTWTWRTRGVERVRRCHIASFESHMVVNTQTVERYLFINLFIILIYIAKRSQMSILINFRILQHKRFDVNQDTTFSPSNREFLMHDLGHYLFQKTDCAIRRKVSHRVIVSCFGQRNMIYKFFINI